MPVSHVTKPAPVYSNRIFSVEDVSPDERQPDSASFAKPLLIGIAVILLLVAASMGAVILKTGWAPWSDKNLYDDGRTEGTDNDSNANTSPVVVTSPSPDKPKVQTPAAGSVVRNQIGMELVLIPPGSFMMGSASGNDDEKPVHQVTINYSFYFGKHEVTQTQWQAVMGDNPSHFRPCGDCPVESVTWEDTQSFVRKLNQLKDGYSYRLPSEAEWEYASRAGRTADNAGDINETAWHLSNAGAKTHAVGSKRPNDWGLYDMDGNVSEWCEDWSHQNYYGAPADGRAWLNDSDQRYRVLRGGSWLTDALYLRFAARGGVPPDSRHDAFGFRVVAVVNTP